MDVVIDLVMASDVVIVLVLLLSLCELTSIHDDVGM
jgi:hypothetical protein